MEKKTPFKELSGSAKVQYIWDYYRIHILVTLCVLGFLGYTVHHYVTFKKPILGLVMINCMTMEDDETFVPKCVDAFFEKQGYDPKKKDITVDRGHYINFETMDANSMESISTLQVLIAGESANVIFVDKAGFDYLANTATYIDVTEGLSEDVLEAHKDDIVYVTDKDTNETYPVGFHLTTDNCAWLASTEAYEECYVGLCYTRDEEVLNAERDFLQYILTE